jgi:hypothetical protein
MIYKVEGGEIKLHDLKQNKVSIMLFTEPIQVYGVSINPTNDKIAILGRMNSPGSKLFVFDLTLGTKILELDIFYDFQWYDSETILFTDGRAIRQLNLKDTRSKELLKFSRVKTCPIGLTVSRDLGKIAFTQYKGDNLKLSIFDISSASLMRIKSSIYRYAWLNNEQIVYNLGDGLRRLDTASGKSVRIFKDVKDLVKNSGTNDDHLKDLFQIVTASDLIINEISDPRVHNDRLYCAVFVATQSEKRIGVVSTTMGLTDLKFHFYGTTGLIDNYYVVNDAGIVGVNLKPNTLVGEQFEPGIQYFQDTIKLDFKGYKPLWNSNTPT